MIYPDPIRRVFIDWHTLIELSDFFGILNPNDEVKYPSFKTALWAPQSIKDSDKWHIDPIPNVRNAIEELKNRLQLKVKN